MPAKCRQPSISESQAKEIERLAHAEIRSGKTKRLMHHMALTRAAEKVLGCKPRRAIGGEGSLNYIRSIGRFRWDSR